jgi:hypothetical protein
LAAAPDVPSDTRPEVVVAVRSCLDGIAAEMTEEILRSVPEYSRTQDGTYATNIRRASELAVRDFAERVTEGACDGSSVREMFRETGRIEAGLGRDLGTLQTAMHVGARVMWRRLSDRLTELELPAEAVGAVAGSLLSHFAANATAAAEGHAQGRTRLADRLHLHRHRLVDLLLAAPPPSPGAVGDLARNARWPIPETVTVVVVPGLGTLDLPPGVLPGLHRSEPCLVVPDPDEGDRQGQVEKSLHGLPAVVGPSVPLAEAATSLRRSLEALELRRRGILDGFGVIRTADHLSTLLMFQNEDPDRRPAGTVPAGTPRPAGPAGRDAAGLAGDRARRERRGGPPVRAPADHPLPRPAAGRALRGPAVRPGHPPRTGTRPPRPSPDRPVTTLSFT